MKMYLLLFFKNWINRFTANGGKCIVKRISSFADVGDEYDVVVNCTAIGAKSLIEDPDLVPVRGQVNFVIPMILVLEERAKILFSIP